MSHELEYFMWGYQTHYWVRAKLAAEGLFGRLDAALVPEVGLVGFLVDGRAQRHPVCIEPQDWVVRPEMLTEVLRDAEMQPTAEVPRSAPLQVGGHGKMPSPRAVRDALLAALGRRDVASDRTYFCGGPSRVEGYDVFVVLSLRTDALKAHPHLAKEVRDNYTVPVSLVRCAIDEFLADSVVNLCQADAGGFGVGIARGADELLRAAGSNLMHAPEAATADVMALYVLHSACERISVAPYEGRAAKGVLAVSPRDHPDVNVRVRFARPTPLSETRAARKLLCMAEREGWLLLSDGRVAYGLGSVLSTYDVAREDLFMVEFRGVARWTLLHANAALMEVRFGDPALPKPPVERKTFTEHVRSVIGVVNDDDLERLWEMVSGAAHAGHGATLVITPAAETEAVRLSAQATPVDPFRITNEILACVTSIDGAVVVDQSGTCHAIGAILDGRATADGDPSRGSRFNSALRYCASLEQPVVAVVVSDDGTIDLLPRPGPSAQGRV